MDKLYFINDKKKKKAGVGGQQPPIDKYEIDYLH
jgi:hypothetical protein